MISPQYLSLNIGGLFGHQKCIFTLDSVIYWFVIVDKNSAYSVPIETMHMFKKKQVHHEVKSVQNEIEFIHQLFGIAS